jgi:hypothetical protein
MLKQLKEDSLLIKAAVYNSDRCVTHVSDQIYGFFKRNTLIRTKKKIQTNCSFIMNFLKRNYCFIVFWLFRQIYSNIRLEL